MKITKDHPLYSYAAAVVSADEAFDIACTAVAEQAAKAYRSAEHLAACEAMAEALDRYNDAVGLYNKAVTRHNRDARIAAKRN